MEWDTDLFREIKETESVLPPTGGLPSALAQFQEGDRIVQPVLRRKDYLTDTWCHLNLARASRPFTAPQLTRGEEMVCFLCSGNEHSNPRDVNTGGDTITLKDTDGKTRAFPNLYPWLIHHGNVVESVEHKASLKDVEVDDQVSAFATIRDLCNDLETKGLYPMVFKNQGWGASTAHTHWQYGALPYVPKRMAHELATAKTFANKWNENVFDAIIASERKKKDRFVGETEFVACIVPYAPRSNYEMWLILKKPTPSLTSASAAELESLATVMTKLLLLLYHELSIDSLSLVFHQIRGEGDYRLHLEMLPYKHWAGAERGYEEYAVEVMPEQGADFLRKRFGRM
jgi:UDPglucose--hexose-1-phosphate uridylyltransferase